MKLPKSWTHVTPFSKMLALALFTTLPVLGFIFGIYYHKTQLPQMGSYCQSPVVR